LDNSSLKGDEKGTIIALLGFFPCYFKFTTARKGHIWMRLAEVPKGNRSSIQARTKSD